MFVIEDELKKLPGSPGVYIMHDSKDNIIYVGKAISLKNRVRQYFRSSTKHSEKIKKMVSNVAYFEYIVTDSELEALVLECNLIKEHRPKYNTMLKDDKSYPYIKVTVNEPYPRVVFARRMGKDKSKYYGPYTSSGAVKDTIELLGKIYKIRTCSKKLPQDIGKTRPCLNYHIGQCKAPCMGYISKEEYKESIDKVTQFLSGDFAPVLKMLNDKMKDEAAQWKFEEAAVTRDLIESVNHIATRQKINDNNDLDDRDVIGCAVKKGDSEYLDYEAVICVFFIRNGRLLGRDHFHMTSEDELKEQFVIESFIKQYYSGTPFIPRKLMLHTEVEDINLLEEWLGKIRGGKVSIVVPKKGEKEKMVELACSNARLVLEKDAEKLRKEERSTIGAMEGLSEILELADLHRVESFDISNISGFQSVGSMVVFEDGKPKKSDYRKFKIKTVNGPDDYASMYEVLTRRFTHAMQEKEELREKGFDESTGSFTRLPDIIFMDGGKGQVNVASQVLSELGLNIPVCGMVKDDHHRTRGLYFDDRELPIKAGSEEFRLITRIQDETHRFAIEYHRQLRSKGQVHSVLDDIPGIGEKRRKALMVKYRSIEEIKAASVEELAATPTMDMKAALAVYEFFKEKKIKV